MASCNCESPSRDSELLARYQSLIEQAQHARNHGHNCQALQCYRGAFDISVALFDRSELSAQSMSRLVESCRYCCDIWPAHSPQVSQYLDIAAVRLSSIISNHYDQNMRALALQSSADIAGLAHQLLGRSDSERAKALLWHFKQQWATHAQTLIQMH